MMKLREQGLVEYSIRVHDVFVEYARSVVGASELHVNVTVRCPSQTVIKRPEARTVCVGLQRWLESEMAILVVQVGPRTKALDV
jgi:hypothetical protein